MLDSSYPVAKCAKDQFFVPLKSAIINLSVVGPDKFDACPCIRPVLCCLYYRQFVTSK